MQVAASQISPGENYDIFYFLRNHTDATTYYVRARVYDVRTGEVLDTVNLEQAATNSRLFIKTATAPGDSAGYGRNIVAIATVYTDSGYTTKSENYEEQEQYFLVKAPSLGGGGGGFIDLSGIIQRLDALDAKIKALPAPTAVPDMPFDALFGAIGVVQREINRIPKELPDGAPLMERIAAIHAAIEKLPSPEKLDLTPVSTKLAELSSKVDDLPSTIEGQFPALTSAASQEVRKAAAALLDKLESVLLPQIERRMQEFIGTQELSIPIASLLRPGKRAQREEAPDLSHLM